MLSFSILPLLAFGLICSAQPLEKRQLTDTTSFKLYAYGPGISGLPISYLNVTASTDGSNTWTAHPSSTEGVTTLSTNTNKLCLEQGSTNSNPVGFTGTTSREQTNQLSNVWSLYGSYVLVSVSGANFYARQTENGLYSVLWSSSAEAMTDTIPLVLRTAEPATESVLTSVT
ncbi:hypothetical protein N7517_007176 [Penicillium concentricum]|uniref:Lipocalin-like domain-containing protein n=1 Tax=Penicillium concentricum TaxID=293559 RepID=A0A9W9SB63_9EURO|nr:uncharacterized protein N7517_007176 [Penicillium concentricum]KAJ5375170.1 hypothetical protein N7517_007176 [Penicillium concentricum]